MVAFCKSASIVAAVLWYQASRTLGFPLIQPHQSHAASRLQMSSPVEEENVPLNVRVNEFFKLAIPAPVRDNLDASKRDGIGRYQQDFDLATLVTAGPGSPGVPRPVWLVVLASIPTGFLWYGYYKFAVEEELMQQDLLEGKTPRGFGGYGTIGPFLYSAILGPLAIFFHIPGGLQWSYVGVVFIYYTQFLLYDRVNQLYKEEGLEEPLSLWWTLPIFFPFDLIVGLRQAHFLSQYWYYRRGVFDPPIDPVVNAFPFIGASRFTWEEFLLTPSLWCKLFSSVGKIDPKSLPETAQAILGVRRPETKRINDQESSRTEKPETTRIDDRYYL